MSLDNKDTFYYEHKERIDAIATHYRAILELLGEDTGREGLKRTPFRAAKALVEVTQGYEQNPSDLIRSAMFDYSGRSMVIVKDIEFYSLCEHHILPFFGKVSVGYMPEGKIVGLSKIARVVNALAKRLQVQERLTSELCEVLTATLGAKGVIVLCEAGHLCMKMRGVEKQDSMTSTLEYSGVFDDEKLRSEFMEMLNR
ncbi:MAG: GTP cyclohydrolase I FolE [Muribaculaceae bacterium]|nr:GTP cyclohydrolase I FolE [Muribaculaceae bacterium]